MTSTGPGKPPFESIVQTHGAAVLRVCRALLGPIDADDAWSETVLSALRAYPDLPDDANAEAWLVTIAHRKAIDAMRSRGRRPTPVAQVPDAATQESPDHEVWPHVAALPDRQRAAVICHHVAGLPYRDVANIMDCSEAAARRSAADGMASLRATLTKERTP